MKKRFLYIGVLFSLAIFTSCLPLNYVQIQIAEPGKEDLPENIQSLTLVNRSVDERFEDVPADSIQLAFYKSQFDLDTVIYDLTAADTVIRALGELLYESGRYDVIIPQDRFLPHQRNMFFSVAMPWEEVQALCDTFHTDAVLSLDYFKTSVSAKLNSGTFYNSDDDLNYMYFLALMAIRYEAIIRIYDPSKRVVVNRSVLTDTLIWDNSDFAIRPLFTRFTSVKSALTEAGIALALKFSDRISPKWHNETRKYFRTEIPWYFKADTLARQNKWEEALDVWLSSLESVQTKNKNLRSKIEYNIALCYEMNGNIEEAIKWGVKSYSDMYRPITVDYLNILKKRREQIEKISKK